MALLLVTMCAAQLLAATGPPPPPPPKKLDATLRSYRGATPQLDGVLAPGEYDDAFTFKTPFSGGKMQWVDEFSPVLDPAELSMTGFIKHDKKALYLAFNISDDFLYCIQGKRWAPKANPDANVLNRTGWPWFGDEMEVLLNSAGPPPQACTNATKRGVVGTKSEWQMVLNLEKSRLGGLGVGGLMEGEPRSSLSAWNNYQSWIESGKMQGAAKVAVQKKGANVWVAEWRIAFELMEIKPGQPYSADMPDTHMSLNLALGDVDTPAEGNPDYGIRHEQWPCGTPGGRTNLCEFCTFIMHKGPKPSSSKGSCKDIGSHDEEKCAAGKAGRHDGWMARVRMHSYTVLH